MMAFVEAHSAVLFAPAISIFFYIIWWAAKLTADVQYLKDGADDQKEAMETMQKDINGIALAVGTERAKSEALMTSRLRGRPK